MPEVFIYGTLKRGFPNHQAGLAQATFIGRCRTLRAFPLVVAGRWFSPCLLDEPDQGQRVFGELFDVSDAGLAALDRMEGCDHPLGYRRIAIEVAAVPDGETLEAWTYVKERARLEAIHGEPLADYAPDPRYVSPAKRTRQF